MYEEPEIPAAGEHLWRWFWELDSGRGGSGFGPNPIGWTEMKAWAELNGESLTPWEAQALKAIDGAAMAAMAKHEKKAS